MKKIEGKELEKNSIIVLFLTMLGSAINYLCQIIMGNFFTIKNYGIVNTIFSLILIISVIGTTSFMLISKRLSKKKNENYKVYRYVLKLVNSSVLIITIILICLYPILNKMLGHNNITFILTLLCVMSSVYPILYQGVYASVGEFLKLGLFTLIIPLIKFVGIMILNFINLNNNIELYFVIVLIIFGNFISLLIGTASSRKYFKKMSVENNYINTTVKVEYLNILIINSLLMFLMNVDVLSLSYFYDSKIVGLYSSVLVFGKIVYYFVSALVTVMLPMIAKNDDKKEYAYKILCQTLFYTTILTVILLIPLNVFAKEILNIIFGNKYDNAVSYMVYSSLICLSYSLNVILVNYLVGINKTDFTKLLFAIGIVILMICLLIFNDEQYISLIIIAIINFIIFIINFIKIKQEGLRSIKNEEVRS